MFGLSMLLAWEAASVRLGLFLSCIGPRYALDAAVAEPSLERHLTSTERAPNERTIRRKPY